MLRQAKNKKSWGWQPVRWFIWRLRCYRDNIFVEQLWRSVKYECVYLKAFDNASQLKEEPRKYFQLYNLEGPHQGLGDNTPDQVYFKQAA